MAAVEAVDDALAADECLVAAAVSPAEVAEARRAEAAVSPAEVADLCADALAARSKRPFRSAQ